MFRPIGLFYGSSTCYTQMTAEKIAQCFGAESVDLYNIAETPLNQAAFYRYIIMGIPTWNYGELQEDWDRVWDELADLDLSHSVIALYGQGDQAGYGDWFLDALGYLHHKLKATGAKRVGFWPSTGYRFTASKAQLPDSRFVGLALDDDNEFDLSADRISRWCEQIWTEMDLAHHLPPPGKLT